MEMLQVARVSPKLLGDSADLVRDFFLRQQNSDGGFKDREGRSDLYYTVFALDGLLALQAPVPVMAVREFLSNYGDGRGLDFVHLCCLAHCWWAIRHTGGPEFTYPEEMRRSLLDRIEGFRTQDGGYNVMPGQVFGSAYGAFLAAGAHDDLQSRIPEPGRLVQSLKFLETPDGAWANERHIKTGATNATAAAVVVLHSLDFPVNAIVGDWLMAQVHPMGGLLASPATPMPDLLSTATALHALACLNHDISTARERCLDFVDSLWTNDGGFFGHWADDTLDCEYNYYGLLALGHLSV